MYTLNPAQRAAVSYLDGPLLVLAGAGSGKTRVITQKIAYLVQDCGLEPRHIAAITFTNKAAKEMQDRVGKLISPALAGKAHISTFHALGVRVLREEAVALGYKPGFSIFDATDCAGIIAELSASLDKATVFKVQGLISQWKNALLSPDQVAAQDMNETEKLAAHVYRSYAATLQAYQAVDFDDLITLPVRLFAEHSEVLEKWQNRLRYLLVDEYQDTNVCQYQLLRQLAGARAQFTAVGDDDQSIYAWRGAEIENIRRLPNDYPQLKLIKLEQNYRSTLRILKAANQVIAHNPKVFEKELWSELGLGEVISVTACPDSEAEAESVVMKMQAHKFEQQTRWGDYAILYRSNHLARVFEQHLRNQKIPYLISGGQSFFDRAEIKDITAYLRLLANEDDDPAFIRAATTPKRGIGSATLEALGQYAGSRHLSLFAALFEEGFAHRLPERQLHPLREFGEFINRIQFRAQKEPAQQVFPDLLKAIDYERYLYDHEETRTAETRWGNVLDFADWLNRKGEEENKTLIDLAQTIALINLLDKGDDNLNAVQLSTLHAAKGLEFRHVFLVGVEENILPHRESVANEKIEEERRLMYVGITRAQRSLHLSFCEKRKQAREWVGCEPSRFIHEMGKDDLKFLGGKAASTADKATGSSRLAAMKAMLVKNPG